MLQIVKNLIFEAVSSYCGCQFGTAASILERIDFAHEVELSGGFYALALKSGLLVCGFLVVVERADSLGMDVVKDGDLFVLSLIVHAEDSVAHDLFRFVFIGLVIVDTELGKAAIGHFLIEVKRHVDFEFLKCRHERALFGEGELVSVRFQDVDVERTESKVGDC